MKKIEKNPAEIFICSLNTHVSIKNCTSTLNTLSRLMGFSSLKTYPWHEVNYVHIIELKRELIDKGLKPSTINTYLAIFKSAVRKVWRLGIIDIDTYMRVKDVKRVRGDSEVVGKALKANEIKQLVNYKCRKNRIREIRDSAVIAVCYGAGLRRSELVKLDLSDYSDDTLIIKGKGGYIRTMYLPKFAINSLNEWLKIRGNDKGVLFNRLLIGNRITEKRLTPRAIVGVIDRRCELVGIERIAPHDLRSYVPFLTMSGKVMKQTAQSVFTYSVVLNTFVCPT